MKYGLFILGLLFSINSFAQSCGSLADGETIRIDEDNKSLQNFKVQDQDGLGSCYANAASLLLQGNLQGNPEISYLHLATLYKTEELASKRSSAKSSKDFDIYAKAATNNEKAINGGGDAMKWDLAIDGGNTCSLVTAVRDLEFKNKKPVVCLKSGMNLEKILTSGDAEHKQFKTFLETSLYMNKFQEIFGDIDEKPDLFNKKRVQADQEKYKNFKDGFTALITNKKKKIADHDCNRINADSLDSVVAPMTQMALTYSACFKEDFPSKDEYWCQVVINLVHNPKVQADGAVLVEGMNPLWIKKLQMKVVQKKSHFSSQNLADSITDTFVDGLKSLDFKGKAMAKQFMKDRIIGKTSVGKNLEALSNEYNEVATKGFSQACVERNTYNYFQSKEYENDWQGETSLCSYADLMKQATNVIMKYKESGLNDIDTAIGFLTAKAGENYDEAMMALYASDCSENNKVSIPSNTSCMTMDISRNDRSKVNEKIIEVIKANKPLTASLCSAIIKKPKSEFKEGECGNHALGITGIQCVAGKTRYLIQNSWGANTRATNQGIETIDGKGAYWFDEATFFDSVYGMDYIN
ncbi:MAG: hypothetical protein H7177_08280 [Rhizobacter sp.]|nr:hypothetical protein [Bacteriovorax sp.]